MKTAFGDVLRLKKDQGREVTIMVIAESRAGVNATVLDSDARTSFRSEYWPIGGSVHIDGEDMERFEPAPPVDTELAAAFNLVRA